MYALGLNKSPTAFLGEVFYLTTPRAWTNFNEVWRTFNTDKLFLIIHIKACADLHLMLTMAKGSITDAAIDVVIGGWDNTKSVIRTGVRIF